MKYEQSITKMIFAQNSTHLLSWIGVLAVNYRWQETYTAVEDSRDSH